MMMLNGSWNVAVRADVVTVSVPLCGMTDLTAMPAVTALTMTSPVTRQMEVTPQAAESHRAEPHRPQDEAEGVWIHRIDKSIDFAGRSWRSGRATSASSYGTKK